MVTPAEYRDASVAFFNSLIEKLDVIIGEAKILNVHLKHISYYILAVMTGQKSQKWIDRYLKIEKDIMMDDENEGQ